MSDAEVTKYCIDLALNSFVSVSRTDRPNLGGEGTIVARGTIIRHIIPVCTSIDKKIGHIRGKKGD